jgi:hypothetical protein
MRIEAKLEEILAILEDDDGKKKTLNPDERARLAAAVREVQREVRALRERLQARLDTRGRRGYSPATSRRRKTRYAATSGIAA